MQSVPPPGIAPAPSRERGPDEPPWQSWTVLATVGVGLGVSIALSIVIAIIAQAAGSSVSNPSPAVELSENFVFDLAFVAAAVYFALYQTRAVPADFGFRRVRLRRGVGAFLVAGVGYYVLTAIYATVLNLHGSEKLPKELGVGKSTAALAAATVFVCVVAPIAEEFFFRGFVFGALRRWRIRVGGRNLGTWAAAIVTGLFFGAVHASSAAAQYLVPLAFLGFVLCLVRWYTRSLYPCMALHSFNNSLALGVNQLHWSAVAIVALMVGSWAVIAAITGPLSGREAVPRPG
jgi:CAAX protease family protein